MNRGKVTADRQSKGGEAGEAAGQVMEHERGGLRRRCQCVRCWSGVTVRVGPERRRLSRAPRVG